jgi:SAM-dependent methyltransferase
MLTTTHVLIDKFASEHDINGRVLDVGSLDVNGNIKGHFKDYTGIDMRDGKNVDKVINAHAIKEFFKEGEFDIVCCFDTLEHDDKFWVSIENMKWVLKKGGWLLVGTPSINHGKHDHPFDFYRFTGEAFKQVIFEGMDNVFVEEQFYGGQEATRPDQVFGWGQKI